MTSVIGQDDIIQPPPHLGGSTEALEGLTLNSDLGGVLGVLVMKYREFLEGALWQLLASSGALGVIFGL